MDYNILATTEKITMSAASSQLWMNLRAIGDPNNAKTEEVTERLMTEKLDDRSRKHVIFLSSILLSNLTLAETASRKR